MQSSFSPGSVRLKVSPSALQHLAFFTLSVTTFIGFVPFLSWLREQLAYHSEIKKPKSDDTDFCGDQGWC
jgi:hypothetical protein